MNLFIEENYCINRMGLCYMDLGNLKNSGNFFIKSIRLCFNKKKEFSLSNKKQKNLI